MHALAVDHAAETAVHAVKRVKAGRARLDRPRAQDQLAVEADIRPRHALHGRLNGAGKIAFCVGQGRSQRKLTAGENHGLFLPQQHKAQRCGGITHGVRAVRDHHAVAVLKGLVDGTGQLRPFLGLDITGIH